MNNLTPGNIRKIKDGIYVLRSTLANNPGRVNHIMQLFIDETPLMCDDIYDHIVLAQWEQVGALVHKVKTRYGYIGLTEVVDDLSALELKLQLNERNPAAFKEKIRKIRLITDQVVTTLQQCILDLQAAQSKEADLPLLQKFVLIAEDDEVNAMVFDLFVRETGAFTRIATDGMQAIELARQQKPDLVFMDVHMPFFSGLEAIREMRAMGFTCPIISLSASSRLNERVNSLEAGADEFIIKPANKETINGVLLKYLSR
jgi:CheY-like chemotaxis protein